MLSDVKINASVLLTILILDVRTDWPDHSLRIENFTFNQDCLARYVKS